MQGMQTMRRFVFWTLIVITGSWAAGMVAAGLMIWRQANTFALGMVGYSDRALFEATRDGFRYGGLAVIALEWGLPLLFGLVVAALIKPPPRQTAATPPRQPPTLP